MSSLILILSVGIPVFGNKIVLYSTFLVRELFIALNLKKAHIKTTFILVVFPLFISAIYRDVVLDVVAIGSSLVLGYSFARRVTISRRSLLRVALFLLVSHIFSFWSLYDTGIDRLPFLIYGESRHEVPLTSPFPFRPSGFFQEPSSLCAIYLALLALARKIGYDTLVWLLLFASFCTFSGISLLALIMVNWKRSLISLRYWSIIFLPLIIYLLVNSLVPFVIDKVLLYSGNIENYSRVIDIISITRSDVIFGKMDYEGVILDNGPLLFLLLKFGVFALPLMFYIVTLTKNNLFLVIILFIKLSVTLPLIWLVLFYENTRNSRERTRIL